LLYLYKTFEFGLEKYIAGERQALYSAFSITTTIINDAQYFLE